MFSYIISANAVTVVNLETGASTTIDKVNQGAYDKAVAFVKVGEFEEVEKLTVKHVLSASVARQSTFDGYSVWLGEGVVKYATPSGQEFELHNALTSRLIDMASEGFDTSSMLKFLANLLANPSKTSIDELYLFLEATQLPITDDGCFIAYKMVREDYTSIHDQKFMNKPGTVVEMPRNQVDDNRDRTCSNGLHFCSKNYLKSYGSGQSDRLLLVKINPADVVSIPSDYGNAKGRASKYLIWKDITEDGWREKYGLLDYNAYPVESDDNWDEEDDFDNLDDDEEDDWTTADAIAHGR